jgi:hypothetical protein
MSSDSHSPSLAPVTLDYEYCTAAELYEFLEERTGTTINKEQSDNVDLLTNRLRELDRQWTFPRFLELPPELRLHVHEALLVESDTLHPAILRTSKQVHSEALPVLYKRNKFRARVKYCIIEPYWRGAPVVGCCLKINRNEGDPTFHQHVPRHLGLGTLRRRLFRDRTVDMLRILTHFTIDLDLATPGKEDAEAYACQAYDAILSLCLALIGPSKLKKLTIKVNTNDSHVTSTSLESILWPLVFLRTDIVVKIEGADAVPVPEREEVEGLYMNPEQEALFGRSIARVRRLCSEEIEKRGWENDDGENHAWPADGVRPIERALYGVDFYGTGLIRLDDILSSSPVWERIRFEADRMEVRPWQQ